MAHVIPKAAFTHGVHRTINGWRVCVDTVEMGAALAWLAGVDRTSLGSNAIPNGVCVAVGIIG